MKKTEQPSAANRRRQVADSMGIGVVLGIVLGTALGNIALGLTIGIVIGGVGSLWRSRRT